MANLIQCFIPILLVSICFYVFAGGDSEGVSEKESIKWKKHVIADGRLNLTAVAVDANGDKKMDVITSYSGKVSLFVAPDWKQEVVLYEFGKGGKKAKDKCIHSAVLDVDGDGDLDWAGSTAHGHPFWLENPGVSSFSKGKWKSRVIDPEITAIHCIRTADVDNDGVQDLIINNFAKEKGIKNSMVWLSVPEKPSTAKQWDRHVFADGDAAGGSHYMGAGDIDGDGWKEIAVGAKGKPFNNGNWFAFWKNPGEEGISDAWEKVVLAENQEGATNILPADVNGDGKVDWVASRGHGTGVLWFENPSWEIHEVDEEIKEPHSLVTLDFDQDGDMDIATCAFGSKWVRWYENDGSGKFNIHTIDTDQQSYHLNSVDMDGDGDMDLLNAGRGSKNVVWYENMGGN